MNTETTKVVPYGLFRYLYNSFQVRYPDYYMFVEPMLPRDAVAAVGELEAKDLEAHMATHSWLIGLERPDLFEAVQALWDQMSARSRGDYLAGFTERTYFGCPQMEARLSFICEQLSGGSSIELTPETGCEIGCCLLAMGKKTAFSDLLQADIDWSHEIDRASPRDAKRWNTIGELSRRVIDVFFEAALILKKSDAAKLMLKHGANPNIFVWRLERSCNVRYSALSYAIDHELDDMVDAIFENNVDPSGLESAASRSPLSLAFENSDFQLIRRLLQAGASLEDGPRYEEAPFFYARNCPIDWVREQLTELLGLLPIEAKPIFHRPNAQAGYYYTLLECVWGDPEKLAFAEEIGLDLRLTEYEIAKLIQKNQYTTFCTLVGRLGESVKDEALARVQRRWPDFSPN